MEEQEVTLSRTSDAQIVKTVGKGMAGVSPGAPMSEWDVKNAVPIGNFEFDAGKKIIGNIPAKLYILGPAGMQNRGECFIISDTFTHAVNQEAVYTFKAVGPMSLWQL
jgi:hypothetical protein